MIVGKSAEFKKIPKAIMLELKSRALLQIAGQKREARCAVAASSAQVIAEFREGPARVCGKGEWKALNVFSGERSDVFFRWVDPIFVQNIANNSRDRFFRRFRCRANHLRVRNRVRTIVLSDSTPAPPVFTSVPSMSKEEGALQAQKKSSADYADVRRLKKNLETGNPGKMHGVPDYFVDSLLPDLSSSPCAATQMTNDG